MGPSISNWTVQAESAYAPAGIASFPASESKVPGAPYVLVTVGDKQVALKVVGRTGASGTTVFVAPGTLDLQDKAQSTGSWATMTLKEYSNHQLFHTRSGRLTILGFVLGLIGIAIDSSLKVGNVLPAIRITPRAYASLLVAASALQAIGLCLVFVKAVRRSDF